MEQPGSPSPAPGSPPPGAPPQQQYAPTGAPPNEPNAVMAMVLGILGVVVCGIIAPFAWSIGKKSLNNVRAHPGQFSGEGMAQAGYILGIIGTILLIVAGIFILFWLLFVVAFVGTGFAA